MNDTIPTEVTPQQDCRAYFIGKYGPSAEPTEAQLAFWVNCAEFVARFPEEEQAELIKIGRAWFSRHDQLGKERNKKDEPQAPLATEKVATAKPIAADPSNLPEHLAHLVPGYNSEQ